MDGRTPHQAFIDGLPKKEKTEKKMTQRQRNHHPARDAGVIR
jgi:hypothetical protein